MVGLTPSPSTGVVTAAEVWAYATRALTTPSDYMANVATISANITILLTRISAARAGYLDNLSAALPSLAHFDITEFEKVQAPTAENAAVTITVTTADQSLGSKNITVDIPAGATIISVIAVAKINILNNSANAQKIDLKFDVEGTTLFDQDDVVGFGATDGASTSYTIAEDASDEVTADAQVVTLEAFATLSAAQSVILTAQYYLFITYTMG